VQQHYQKFPFDELVQKEFSLQQINEAFEYATKNLPIRVGINMIN
jgi:Zn-dependent alcohol dehydrogenase